MMTHEAASVDTRSTNDSETSKERYLLQVSLRELVVLSHLVCPSRQMSTIRIRSCVQYR